LIFSSSLFWPLGIAGGPDGFVVFDLFGDDCVEDDGNFVSRRGSGGFGAQFGFHATQVVAQGGWTAMKRIGRHTKDLAGPALYLARAFPQRTSATDIVIRTQIQPGNEMRRGWPSAGQIPAHLAEQRGSTSISRSALCSQSSLPDFRHAVRRAFRF
jgi:hypothetical protein